MVEVPLESCARRSIWHDVMRAWCRGEILETYASLSSSDAQTKMLDALKSKVMHTLLEQNKRQCLNSLFSNGPMKIDNSPCSSPLSSSSREDLLKKAVTFEGSTLTFDHFEKIKGELHNWGIAKSRSAMLLEHEQKSLAYRDRFINNSITSAKSVLEHFKTLSSDATVTKRGLKTTDNYELRDIRIKDLKLFETSRGCCLRGTLIGYARLLVGLTTLLKDDDGDIIQITIYNVIPDGPEKIHLAEKLFPHGLRMVIKEPFLKIFRDGNRGVRVDDPSDLCILNGHEQSIEDIRKQGKQLMNSEEYLLAFEVYCKGIHGLSETVIPILNNRSQTEIKLGQYEEALLDAAAVLFFKIDKKAHDRYNYALEKLRSYERGNPTLDIWSMVLKNDMFIERVSSNITSREIGNDSYIAGDYMDAKRNYTSALVFPDISLLLTNISIACLQLGMFETAIAASSACLRIATEKQRKQKAYYCMAKAFLMLRRPRFYALVKSFLNDCTELDKLLFVLENSENIFRKTLDRCNPEDGYTAPELVNYYSQTCDLVSDFLQPETMEHVYIEGKGRGIRAARDIKKGELLLVDHPILGSGVDVEETKTFTRSFNFNTQLAYGIGDVHLAAKLLKLVHVDGRLAEKLLCLEKMEAGSGKALPLLNLNDFSYRQLRDDALPFLPQTNDIINTDISGINEEFIQNILTVNTFNHDSIDKNAFCKGSALCLRISLFNHDDMFNCRVLPFGNALVLFAIKDIPKCRELTIYYSDGRRWQQSSEGTSS